MKNIYLILIYFSIGIFYCSCSSVKQENNNYDITFVKSKGSFEEGICNVLMKLPEGITLVVDSFECRSQTEDTVLFKDISKLPNFVFGLIDTLPLPKGYGSLLKKYALAKDYAINNRGISFITFYRYYLFTSNGKVILIKEKWKDDGKDGVAIISNECLYPISKSSLSDSEKEKNGIYTKTMIYKWCECDDACMSSFIDENGKEYDFGNPSNEKYSFDCSMYNIDDNIKKDSKIGKQFEIQYEISDSGIKLISINPTIIK
jgi:hypothetical protein